MGCATSKAAALPVESVDSPDAVIGDEHYSTITSSMQVKSGIVHEPKYAPVNVSATASIATTVSLRSPCAYASMASTTSLSLGSKSTTAFADVYALEDPLGNGGGDGIQAAVR